MLLPFFPKELHLGSQNGSRSSGPRKLLKIVNCATIKETEKPKETMVGSQVELEGGHQYPPESWVYPQEDGLCGNPWGHRMVGTSKRPPSMGTHVISLWVSRSWKRVPT